MPGDAAGQTWTAPVSVAHGDAMMACIDTMIEVIKADIAHVGMAPRL
jgi:hypothetical protein